MAVLLHRLGRWCARRPWPVVGAWVALLALTVTGMLTLAKPLANEFSIPGSRFEAVLATLKAEIPEAAGTTGTAVFRSDDGFTADQQAAIEDAVAAWNEIDDVLAVDPFATQAEIDGSAEQLASGRAELEAGRAELEAGEEELAQGRFELDGGQSQLDAAVAGGFVTPEQAAQAQAEIDAGREQLEAGEAQLAEGRAELEAGEAQLVAGERMAALSDGLRLVNESGTVAMSQISVQGADGVIPPETMDAIKAVADDLDAQGVETSLSAELTSDISSIFGPGEIVGLAVAAVVLIVMLGSLVAAGLPLLMALVGVGVGLTGALALSSVVDMQSITPALALMLGLAVGIDYSLFLINRHRQQVMHGMSVESSIALAVGTSGNAVTFAGLTVVIALAALTLTGIPFLGVMGLVAAGTVAIAVLVALTLTPAMLSLMRMRVLSKRTRAALARGDLHDSAEQDAREADTHRGWAAFVAGRPWLMIVGVLAIVAALGYPTGQLRLGLPDGASEPAGSDAYITYDTVRSEFGAGASGPIIAVAELDQPIAEGDETELLTTQADIGEEFADIYNVEYVVPVGVNDTRDVIAFQIQPATGPADPATERLVDRITQIAPRIGADNGAEIGLTGVTVANIDISNQLAEALPLYLFVVVGLSLILLLLVFRSVVIPFLATGGFLLSIVAAFGAVVAVYQLGHLSPIFGVNEPGPIISFLPILLIGILFGLAMDYQVFLVSAMREEHVHGRDARTAVITGFNHSARVVTAAAIIMISVFGGFVWAHLALVRPIGLGLAVGVLVDAFIVRMTLTPAVMTLLGEKAWWIPRWLDRILPDVDVEGAKLERALDSRSDADEVPTSDDAPDRVGV
ncbi:MMPL family transporter [Nostocoides sp. F2B08]|uniref:MMPL family transporter n=1 Tax=Nostocoides sp. F2B08 TaxID=2653936 RepID=UPI001263652F|nr:MMPL family transporter [Tetrasphaera sp. F2B08]KAB7745631.1 MMPL family transporter [Tetrasphaera sp. F2B08]